LTADEADEVVKLIEHASRATNCEVFRQWLMQFECHEDVIVVDSKTYRFKMVSEKTFLTKFGVITVSRRIFQQDNGGQSFIPLDVAWEMQGEFATRDVRECVLYMSAFMSPSDIETCLQKAVLLIRLSRSRVKRLTPLPESGLRKHRRNGTACST